MNDDTDGISPTTAGFLLFCCTLIGGVFLVGLWYMNRTEDPLYKRDPRFIDYRVEAGASNSAEVQTGTNLWKDKKTDIAPLADKVIVQPPAPAQKPLEILRPAPTDKPAPPPTSQPN